MLLTLPITQIQAVLGKFLAAWAFTAIALGLTFPLWVTVNYLGSPDNGVILASYIGSLLMAGAFLAVGSTLSALTKNQVIAFVLTAALSCLLTVSGTPLVLEAFSGWAPAAVTEAVASLSFLTHFQAIQRGVLDLRDFVFFGSLIALFLYANAIALDLRKAD
jgi:ABC-2 type transport system permease protein